MFEALFILTAVDAGTRVGRFMLQDTIGNLWPRYADTSWKPASWSASAVVVGLWGYMLYVGVTDPLGGINQLFPLFGIANQLLAAIALTLCVTLLIKHGKAKWVWVPGIGLVWDLVVTMTASWQKVFSDNPAIGYFSQRSRYQARDAGELLAPADGRPTRWTDHLQLHAQRHPAGALRAAGDRGGGQRAGGLRPGAAAGGLPTTEVPAQPSYLVAPSDFFATPEEKEAVRAGRTSEPATAGGDWGRRPRASRACGGSSASSPARRSGTTTSSECRRLGVEPSSRQEFDATGPSTGSSARSRCC